MEKLLYRVTEAAEMLGLSRSKVYVLIQAGVLPSVRAHGSLDWSEPIEPRAFYRNVYLPTLVGVGLPKSRLHDLRHAFARTYLANGGDIHRLSEQMGHGSYRITYDVYAEWIPSEDDAPNPLDQRRNESQSWGSSPAATSIRSY